MNLSWSEWNDLVARRPELEALLAKPAPPSPIVAESMGFEVRPQPALARGVNELGQNKLEAAFHAEAKSFVPSPFAAVAWEPLKLRIAGNTSFRPDFLIVDAASHAYILIDVKGFMRDDAAVKVKTSASIHPYFRFAIVQRAKVGRARRWLVRRVCPVKGIRRPVALDSLGDLIHHV